MNLDGLNKCIDVCIKSANRHMEAILTAFKQKDVKSLLKEIKQNTPENNPNAFTYSPDEEGRKIAVSMIENNAVELSTKLVTSYIPLIFKPYQQHFEKIQNKEKSGWQPGL